MRVLKNTEINAMSLNSMMRSTLAALYIIGNASSMCIRIGTLFHAEVMQNRTSFAMHSG